MIKRSPSRNHRSKGNKVKHVLQIILLVGVCFWLIYQVKHSHDKKKEFDENDAKVSVRSQTAYQIPKLGRKDLSGEHKVNQKEKHEEEEEAENIVEDDENKHEHNELEEEGNGHETEETEDGKHGVRGGGEEQELDERWGGDDEIDENDQEKSEVDTDRDEEFMDEEKEKEEEADEKENENGEDEGKGGSEENHSTHEAREEHYKGDDASSAVTHDTHATSTETETDSLENSDVSSEKSITKSENKPNYREESNRNQTGSDFKVAEVELTGGPSSNATSGKETGNNSLSNLVDSSHLNNTATTYSDSHFEATSSLTVMITEASNNMTGSSANTSRLSEQNKMVISSESNQARSNTVNTTVAGDIKNIQTEGLEQGGNRVSEENHPGSNSTVPVKTENGDAAAGESFNLEGGELEKTIRFVASSETQNNSRNLDRKESIDASEDEKSRGNNTETSETYKTQNNNSYMKENTDASEDERFKGDTQTGDTDETSDSSSAHGTSDSVEQDATDSHILKDVTDVRTDLDTLPNVINEGGNGDETATE